MTTFKIGNSQGSMSFLVAYDIAENGDVFEFERGYKVEISEAFQFEKSLTLIGNIGVTDSGQRSFSNVLTGIFLISNASKVIIKNFWINPNNSEYFNFYCIENSELILDMVFINMAMDERNYLISSKQNSKVTLMNIEMSQKGKSYLSEFESSEILILNSQRFHCSLHIENSELKIEKSNLTNSEYSIIFAKNNSKIFINQSKLFSNVTKEAEHPVIFLSRSELYTDQTKVIQKDYLKSVYLTDYSYLHSYSDVFSSLFLLNSNVFLNNTTLKLSLTVEQESYVKSSENLIIMFDEILLSSNSTLVAENIEFINSLKPSILLKEGSFGFIDLVKCKNRLSLNIDETSHFIQNRVISTHSNSYQKDSLLELQGLVGLDQVKKTVEQMVNQVKANQKRVQKGLKPIKQTLNAVFMGNPGTGKTTVARLLGKVLFQNGALSGNEFKFIEVSEPDLIAQHIGGTAIQTKKYLDMAKGGVLFIDEAYTLHKTDGSGFGQEAVNTIMKYMEDNRDEIMIIFAGYTKEMEEFLKINPGLLSRAPNRFIFEDYSPEEIVELGMNLLSQEQFKLEDTEYYAKQVSKAYIRTLDNSNGRWIRNFNDKLTKEQLNRVVMEDSDDVETILNIDIDNVLKIRHFEVIEEDKDALLELNRLIGIKKVKRQVQEFIYQAEVNQKKEEMGIKVSTSTLHSLFLGNPGTGKTTVARIIGKILYQKGLISTNKFIEVSRSDLVASYVGETALKTRKILESALGGVLFIDEAYMLNYRGNDFGKESLDEILKFMEDFREDIVIIFAGYTKEMADFLAMNSGLQSRIPNIFDFEDYSSEEIIQIGLLGLQEYKFNIEVYSNCVAAAYRKSQDKSNGRWIRNINEKILRIQASRLVESKQDSFDEIRDEDIYNALN